MMLVSNSIGLNGAARTGLLAGLALFVSGCSFAPGMPRFGVEAPAAGITDTTATYEGVRIELRAMTPLAAKEAQLGGLGSDSIPKELLAYKPSTYRLGPHDVVTIAIWEHPELTMPMGEYRTDLTAGQALDDSGVFYYPYLGNVQARGMTVPQLREKLQTELAVYLTRPKLDVKVNAFRSQKVLLQGALNSTGIVPIGDVPLTLSDAISQKGIRPDADPGRVELLRAGKLHRLNLNVLTADGKSPAQIYLMDGDIVRVPTSSESNVYVMGEVDKQSAVAPVNGKLTLLQALASVGGFLRLSAESRGVYVVRASDPERIKVWHLDASSPIALATSDRFPLQSGDLVFVDATRLAMWNRVVSLVSPTVEMYKLAADAGVATRTLVK